MDWRLLIGRGRRQFCVCFFSEILPGWVIVLFALGVLLGLVFPIALGSIAVGLLCLLIGIRVMGNRTVVWSGPLILSACSGLLMVGACSVATACHPLPSLVWWRLIEWGTIGCLVVTLAVLQREQGERLIRLGTWCSVAFSLSSLCAWSVGELGFRTVTLFGYPNVNVGVNAIAPVLVGAAVLWWRRRHSAARADGIILVVGLLSLLGVALVTGRRGVMAAALFSVGVLLIGWLWSRFRIVAVGGLAVLCVLAVMLCFYWWGQAGLTGSGQRVWIYRSGIDAIVAGGWWGGGFMPAIWLLDIQGQAARTVTMAGMWGVHLHCEPLEILASGGVLALLGFLGFGAGLLWGWRHIVDPDLRLAGACMGLMAGVLALVDPSYSTLIGGGILALGIGQVLKGSMARGVMPAWARLGAGGIAVLAGSLVILGLLPVALTARSALPRDRERAGLLVGDPEMALAIGAPAAVARPTGAEALVVLQALAQRCGWIGLLPYHASDAAWKTGDHGSIVDAEVRILGRDPLYLRSHERLHAALMEMPELRTRVPETTQKITELLLAKSDVPSEPQLVPEDLDGQIAVLAVLVARFRAGVWSDRDDQAAASLSISVGALPSAAAALVQIGLRVPNGNRWLQNGRLQLLEGLAGNKGVAEWLDAMTGRQSVWALAGAQVLWPAAVKKAKGQSPLEGDDPLLFAIRRLVIRRAALID